MIYGQGQINLIDAFKVQNGTANVEGQFVIPMASIVEFDSDMQRGIMFVISNRTTEGNSGVVIHFFRFFNILQWDYSIDLI